MKAGSRLAVALALVLSLSGCGTGTKVDGVARGRGVGDFAGQTLTVFAGSASKPPTEELASRFEKRTGANVEINFGASGRLLTEMETAGKGDVYFPGSSDWMEVAKGRGLVSPSSEHKLVYLVSSVNVQRGNPKGIRSLRDLLRPDIRVVIANPESVCVGAYAVEILENNLSAREIELFRERNLVNYADSCEKTANVVSLKAADAVIGWSVFSEWDPARIETVNLRPGELARIAYVPIGVTTLSRNAKLAQSFVDYMASDEAMSVFKQHGYFTSVEDAQAYIGSGKDLPVGGQYGVPEAWLGR